MQAKKHTGVISHLQNSNQSGTEVAKKLTALFVRAGYGDPDSLGESGLLNL